MLVLPLASVRAAAFPAWNSLHSMPRATSCFRFGRLLHDWPESYFEAQQSRGVSLAGIFKQAIGQQQAQKVSQTRNILARMFPASTLAKMGAQVTPAVQLCLSAYLSICLAVCLYIFLHFCLCCA